MKLYDYAASANCYKVRLLLAQLDRDYERVPVDIFGGDTLTAEFAAINPARTTPVLELRPGFYLPESNAILLALAEGTRLLPEGLEERAQVYRWLFFEQADVVFAVGGLRFRLLTGRFAPDDAEAARRRRAAEEILELLNDQLDGRDYFVGASYTVADISLYAYLHVAGEAGIDIAAYPSVLAWLERVAEQPGYVNDLEPYPANAQLGASTSIYD